MKLPGLRLSQLEVESATAKFDLTMSMMETERGLRATIEYNTDLFEAETIERMMGHFENILEAVVADPEQRVSELEMLSAS